MGKKSKVVTNSKLPPTYIRLELVFLGLVALIVLLRLSGCDPTG